MSGRPRSALQPSQPVLADRGVGPPVADALRHLRGQRVGRRRRGTEDTAVSIMACPRSRAAASAVGVRRLKVHLGNGPSGAASRIRQCSTWRSPSKKSAKPRGDPAVVRVDQAAVRAHGDHREAAGPHAITSAARGCPHRPDRVLVQTAPGFLTQDIVRQDRQARIGAFAGGRGRKQSFQRWPPFLSGPVHK